MHLLSVNSSHADCRPERSFFSLRRVPSVTSRAPFRSARHHPGLAGRYPDELPRTLLSARSRPPVDRPKQKPPVAVAAGGIKAARLAGTKGDALMATEARADLTA